MYIISRPTRRETQERLAESQRGNSSIRGRVRNLEEAEAVQRRLEVEHGEAFEKPFVIDADAPESKQARIEIAERLGFKADPEAVEKFV